MFSRILFSTLTATLLTTAPAFAGEEENTEQCSCCSDGSVHETDHPLREEARTATPNERTDQPSETEEDPFVRNQSYGG